MPVRSHSRRLHSIETGGGRRVRTVQCGHAVETKMTVRRARPRGEAASAQYAVERASRFIEE